MKKFDIAKLIGLAGMALGGVATMITSYAQEREMKRTIREEVDKALAERENNKEESE